MRREMKFDEEKTTCRTLIALLQKMVAPASTNGAPGLDPQRSFSSPAATNHLPATGII